MLLYGAISLVAIYVLLCAIVYFYQRSLIYFPTKDQLPASTTVDLQVKGSILKVSTRHIDGSHAVIYFGGNAEAVVYNLPLLGKAFPNHSLYLMHYRGYDGSAGEPTEANLHADAQALYDWVKAKHSNIIVVGRSLGSGVAIHLAAKNEVARLVLVTPYDSIVKIGKQAFPWLPVGLLMKDRFESVQYAPKIKASTSIIMAEHDEVIPAHSTTSLFNAFRPGVAKMDVVSNVGHNDISVDPSYIRYLSGD